MICVICVRCNAVFALAIVVVIVLRDGYNIYGGVFLKSCTQVLENGLVDLFTGQAGIGVVAGSFVAGVFVQQTKRVNKQTAAVNVFAAVFCTHFSVVAVNALLEAPIGLCSYRVPIQATIFKEGGVFQNDAILQGDVGCGNGFKTGHKVTNTAKLLKELVNAIEHTALVAANNGHACGIARKGCGNLERVVLERLVNRERDGEGTVLLLDLLHAKVLCKLFFGIKLARACAGCYNACTLEHTVSGDVGAVVGRFNNLFFFGGGCFGCCDLGGCHSGGGCLRSGRFRSGYFGILIVTAEEETGQQYCHDQQNDQ